MNEEKTVKPAVKAEKPPIESKAIINQEPKSQSIKKAVAPKKQTSKGVMYDIGNLCKKREGLLEKQEALNAEIADLSAKIEGLESRYAELYRAELQHKIATTWFKNAKMTDKQILKLLEVGSRIHDKIDGMDADSLVKAVTDVAEKSK